MAEVYKALQPAKYLREFLSCNVRPDGRTFDQCQLAVVHPRSIATADGSSIVVLGDTKVCCGIKAELTKPTVENPTSGFVITNLELISLCSPLFKPGPPGDLAQSINQLVADIFKDSNCVNLQDLCVSKEKLVWVLYCDLVCINFSGSIIDASIMALISALHTVKLPSVEYNPNTENCVVDEDNRIPLKILNFPIATTFSLFENDILLANPTFEEEQLCGGPMCGTFIVWRLGAHDNHEEKECMQGVHQLGQPLSSETLQKAIKISKDRSFQIRKLVYAALKTTKEKT